MARKGKPVIKKVQDEYVIALPYARDPEHTPEDGDKEAMMMMYVQLHHTEDKDTPVRITLAKNPLQHKNIHDYHFEESRPEIIECIAKAMLEAVKLARAQK